MLSEVQDVACRALRAIGRRTPPVMPDLPFSAVFFLNVLFICMYYSRLLPSPLFAPLRAVLGISGVSLSGMHPVSKRGLKGPSWPPLLNNAIAPLFFFSGNPLFLMSLCPLVKEEQRKGLAEALQRDFPLPPKRRAMHRPAKHCCSFFPDFS